MSSNANFWFGILSCFPCVQALFVKAESLYHTCMFERALVIFLRAKRLAPDFDGLKEGEYQGEYKCFFSQKYISRQNNFNGANVLITNLSIFTVYGLYSTVSTKIGYF